jgi:hypothetical protein
MLKTKLNSEVLGQFADRGFSLSMPDDHIIVLLHEERSIAIFSQAGATPSSLQQECARHLAVKHGWDGCLWA